MWYNFRKEKLFKIIFMSFALGARRVFFGIFLVIGFFSFNTTAEAAFQVTVSASSRAVAPGQSITVQFWSTQGVFPYDCTYSNSLGWSATRNITAGNRGTAPGNLASYMEEISFTPSLGTTTYSSQCIDGAGAEKSNSTQVFVGSTPVVTLSAGTSSLPITGGSTGISWRVDLATSCTATDGDARWRGLSSLHTGGNLSWTLTSTTTFSLECFNANGDSSGKKSVTVYVGDVPSTCGNGIVEQDKGESCDLGAGNSNTCPVKCSTTCQSNGCDSVVDITMTARPDEYEPGETVRISWDAKRAERCEVVKGEGFKDPIGPSGSVTVTPTKAMQNYAIECYDAGGLSQTGQVAVRLKVEEPELSILSFRAAPSLVPFSSADGKVRYSWNTKYDVEKDNTSKNTPVCYLGKSCSRDGGFCPYCVDESGNITGTGINGSCFGGGRLLKQVSYQGSESIQLTRPTGQRVLEPFVTELLCRYGDSEEEDASLSVYFESDPTLAPQVSLLGGMGSGRSEEPIVISGAAMSLYLKVLGADRCELTDSTGGKVSYPGFVGEKVQSIAKGILTEDRTYTFECWRGELSSRDTLVVKIKDASDGPGDGSGDDGQGTGPTSSTSCATAGSTCQSGTFCTNGATKVGSCNGGLGSCCMTGSTRADAGGPPGSAGNGSASSSNSAYFNPLKFNSVEGVLTGVITQLRNIIVILSIIFIIVGAVMYILSAGNESRMNTAKGAITAALIGLTLAIAAPAFLKEIAAILGWTNITDASNTIAGAQTFTQIATKVLDFLLSIVGIIGIIMLVFGGFVYLTSAGDENKAETGKKIVTYALIAIAVALSALVLVTQVAKFFA